MKEWLLVILLLAAGAFACWRLGVAEMVVRAFSPPAGRSAKGSSGDIHFAFRGQEVCASNAFSITEPKPPKRRTEVETRPYEIRASSVLFHAEPGVGRESVDRLVRDFRECLPRAVAVFGDPRAAGVKTSTYAVSLACRLESLASGTYRITPSECQASTGSGGDFSATGMVERLCAAVLCFSPEPNWEVLSDFALRGATARDPELAPLRELGRDRPSLMKDYYALKLRMAVAGELHGRVSLEQEIEMFSRVCGRDVGEVFRRHGWLRAVRRNGSD